VAEPERRLLRLIYGPMSKRGLWIDAIDATDPPVRRYSTIKDEFIDRPLSEVDPEAFAVHRKLQEKADRGE